MLRNSFLSGLRNTSGMLNNSLPFGVPNIANSLSSTAGTAKALGTASKLSFTGILDNASKTINTINQIVPLYQQIKPMFNNAKTALNIFKSVKNIDSQPTNNIAESPTNTTLNVNYKNEEQAKNEKDNSNEAAIIFNKTIPNKPFFV